MIQQRGVSVEAARLVAGAGDEILKTVVAAHAAAVVGVREDPLETAPPVPLQKLLTEPEKRRAVDGRAAARARRINREHAGPRRASRDQKRGPSSAARGRGSPGRRRPGRTPCAPSRARPPRAAPPPRRGPR